MTYTWTSIDWHILTYSSFGIFEVAMNSNVGDNVFKLSSELLIITHYR